MSGSIAISKIEENNDVINNWQLYVIITIISLVISYATQKFIMTQELYYYLFSGQMEEYRIDDFVNLVREYQIWGYLAIPLLVWLRITIVAFLIQLPFMLKFVEIPFKYFFRIIAIAYFVLLSADIIRFFVLYYQPFDQITINALNSIPFSLTAFIDKESYSQLIMASLNHINLFEFIWCIIVYYGLAKIVKIDKMDLVLIVFNVWAGILLLVFGITLILSTL